jgi:hypothetical protein
MTSGEPSEDDVSDTNGPDDDRLLDALRRAVAGADEAPAEARAAAKALFTWRTVDAELAALVHDSWQGAPAAVRGAAAGARLLSFEADGGTAAVEVEVGPDGRLQGQLVPTGAGEVEVDHAGGVARVAADELGRFRTEPLPSGPVRLRCTTAAGRVDTDWVLL